MDKFQVRGITTVLSIKVLRSAGLPVDRPGNIARLAYFAD